jgi:hypothetical protein
MAMSAKFAGRMIGARGRAALGSWVGSVLGSVILLSGGCGGDDGTSRVNSGGSSGTGTGGSGGLGGADSGAGGGVGALGGIGGLGATDGGSASGPCENLECQQTTCRLGNCVEAACAAGTSTTVSGTVYAPNGTLPLYNVIVYVPNKPLDPISHGATCDQCASSVSGDPVATALTDTKGEFVLQNVPVGNDIPLVLQVGKWRRQVTIPRVERCADTPLVGTRTTRLPASQSQGDMPKIALTTGEADALECLLRKVGIADEEFTTEAGSGTVHLYAGMDPTHEGTNRFNAAFGTMSFSDAQTLWDSEANLKAYDMVLFSCEGSEDPTNKSPAAHDNVKAYLDAGGRVFASHWHNHWVEFGPDPFPTMANFDHRTDPSPGDATIDESFPKGQALAEWMFNVGGSTTRGLIHISAPQATVRTVNVAQRWIYNDQWQAVQYLTQNTPMEKPPEEQCGRIVLSDIHVSSGDKSGPDLPFPDGCTTRDLTPEEKALLFMLFDLSACVTPDDEVPVPPPVK